MTIREKGINDVLRQYTETRGTFTAVYTGVHLYNKHYFINQYENNQSLLFANIYDVNMNISVCDYMFLNFNKTWANLNLQLGDVVQFKAYGELYRIGQHYNPLNTTRCTVNYYRLKYPAQAEKIGKVQIHHPLQDIPVYDLRDGVTYKSFEEYTEFTPYCRNNDSKELLICSLIDGTNASKIWINSRGNVNCSNCKPYVIFETDFDKLDIMQQFAIESVHILDRGVDFDVNNN